MKTINIRTDESTVEVPVLIPFQGAPNDDFANGEEVFIQLVNDDGEKVGSPQVRSVVKTVSADINQSAWYEAYIPGKTKV